MHGAIGKSNRPQQIVFANERNWSTNYVLTELADDPESVTNPEVVITFFERVKFGDEAICPRRVCRLSCIHSFVEDKEAMCRKLLSCAVGAEFDFHKIFSGSSAANSGGCQDSDEGGLVLILTDTFAGGLSLPDKIFENWKEAKSDWRNRVKDWTRLKIAERIFTSASSHEHSPCYLNEFIEDNSYRFSCASSLDDLQSVFLIVSGMQQLIVISNSSTM